MELIAQTLSELGFDKVAGILDGDMAKTAIDLQKSFPNYKFVALPAKDIRKKPARDAVEATDGILDEKNKVQPCFAAKTKALIREVNRYLD